MGSQRAKRDREPVKLTGSTAAALKKAIASGNVAAVERALKRGVSVHALIAEEPYLDSPLLQLAAAAGRAEVVRLLLARGADVNQPSFQLGRPMYSTLGRAASAGHVEVMRLLVDAGTDPDGTRDDRPIFSAVAADQPEAARLLIERGAKTSVTQDGQTPLDLARRLGYARVRKALQSAKAPRGKDTKEGKAFLRDEAARERMQRRWRSGKDAPRPDLARAAQRPDFAALVARVTKLTGKRPTPSEQAPGMVEWTVSPEVADDLLRRHQGAFRKRGAFLLRRSSRGALIREKTVRIALLPTPDPYRIIAALFPGAGNYGMGSADVIAALRAVQRDTPFDLLMVKSDAIELQFVRKVANPERLARLLDAMCPDLVSQGTLSFERLVDDLNRPTPRVYLWWD